MPFALFAIYRPAFSPSMACRAAGSAAAASPMVRIPAEAAFTLPVEACEELDGVSYCKTGEVSVSAMHEAVQKLRADGCSIFFAAIGE